LKSGITSANCLPDTRRDLNFLPSIIGKAMNTAALITAATTAAATTAAPTTAAPTTAAPTTAAPTTAAATTAAPTTAAPTTAAPTTAAPTTPIPTNAKYKTTYNTDCAGNDITTFDGPFSQCAAACDSTPNCVGYVHNKENGSGCWLKNAYDPNTCTTNSKRNINIVPVKYYGAYRDLGSANDRAISHSNVAYKVSTVKECETIARNLGKNVFGVQNGYECRVGTDLASALSGGVVSGVGPMGAGSVNQVYKIII
jgi:hypothetical protein